MRLNHRALWVLSLILFLLPVPGPAHEKYPAGSKEGAYRLGYDYGYQDGFRHGAYDFRRGLGYHPESEEYRLAGRGYHPSYRHKGHYKEGYRSGYLEGYRRAFRRRASWNGRYPEDSYLGPQLPRQNPAFDHGWERGYHDGRVQGETDRRNRLSPNVARHDRFRDADAGYSHVFGSKQEYRLGYRNGFEEGYLSAFPGYR